MEKTIISGSVEVTIPDGFHIMTAQEMQEHHINVPGGKWGMTDSERHITVIILYNQISVFLDLLTNKKKLRDSIKQHGYKNNQSFETLEDFEYTVKGKKCYGFASRYVVDDRRTVAREISIFPKKWSVNIYCSAIEEQAEAAKSVFEEMVKEFDAGGDL